jgi:invasion protein IalB
MRVLTASLAFAAILAAAPAFADTPQGLGTFQNWSAYTTGTGDQKVCYALSQPTATSPKKAKRDPIYLLFSDWPARRAVAEPEIVPGYKYKDKSVATLQVGSQKFQFFTKNDSGDGSAWVEQQPDETRIVAALKSAATATVTGTSMHGTTTKDTYSLAGLADALDKAHGACGP